MSEVEIPDSQQMENLGIPILRDRKGLYYKLESP